MMQLLKKIYHKVYKNPHNLNTLNDIEATGKNNTGISHELKRRIIQNYQHIIPFDIFIETGTYLGIMVEAQLRKFKKIYSIELDQKLYEEALEKFKHEKHVTLFRGDSSKVLPIILRELKEPAIFWLDGHYSGGITALGDKECPILEELDAIFNAQAFNHLLLIDDARLFIGKNDYPTIPELKNYIQERNPKASIKLENDMIVCQINW